jgi:DNA polymerase-3 subunit epsilon
MRFLELKEPSTGVRFAQPVLDTLLLSAVLHPSLDDHRLEAIAQRLGVQVIGRHTALGDALLEAEIFLRLLPLLAERGIVTLGQALDASRQTYYSRLRY